MVSLVKRLTDLWQKWFLSWTEGGVEFHIKGYAVNRDFEEAGLKSNQAL